MFKKVQNFCFQQKLFSPNQSIVVGFSGGPDSTFLVLFLNHLKKSWRLNLHLVHINYGLRGNDSKKDEIFCRKLAEKCKLSLEVVKYRQRGSKGNLEEKLRIFRYGVFEEIRKKKGFDWIAVGHTLDDQAETFLFNLMRGSGIRGLVALRAKNGSIIRPLLGVEKVEILSFLRKQKQVFCLDRTNLELSYTRNRIRQKLIPLLKEDFNPKIKKRLADLIEHLIDLKDWLEKEAEKVFITKIRNDKNIWSIDCVDYLGWPRLIRKEFFRWLIRKIKGDDRGIAAGIFWELEKLAFSQKSKEGQLNFLNLQIKKKKNQLFFKLDKKK